MQTLLARLVHIKTFNFPVVQFNNMMKGRLLEQRVRTLLSLNDRYQKSDLALMSRIWYDDLRKIHYSDITGVTNRSIIYWVKEDCLQNYINIHRNTVDYFMNESIKELNEVNVATVLYHLY